MSAARIAVAAALAALAAWVLKAVAIGVAGGLDESPLEAPLFVLGLVAFLLAVGAFGVALAGGRPLWLRALAGAAGALVGAAVLLAIQSIVTAVLPSSTGWVEVEAGLWISAALAAAVIILSLRARGEIGAEAAP